MKSRYFAFLLAFSVGVSSFAALVAGDEAAKQKLITETYTLADLPIWRGPVGGEHAFDPSVVIALIKNKVPGAENIQPFETNLSLVVQGTQEAHEQVAEVLKSLRQVVTLPPEELPAEAADRSIGSHTRRMRQLAEHLKSHGDLDGSISRTQYLVKNAVTPEHREAYTAFLQVLKEARERHESGESPQLQAPGRYQLIGESGWIYRIDTATGEVVGMPVGAQGWSRVVELGELTSEPMEPEKEKRPAIKARGWTQQ